MLFDRVEVGVLVQELLAQSCPHWILAVALPVHLGPRAVLACDGCSGFAALGSLVGFAEAGRGRGRLTSIRFGSRSASTHAVAAGGAGRRAADVAKAADGAAVHARRQLDRH